MRINATWKTQTAIFFAVFAGYVAALSASTISAKYKASAWYAIFGESMVDTIGLGLLASIFFVYVVRGPDNDEEDHRKLRVVASMLMHLGGMVAGMGLIFVDQAAEQGIMMPIWLMESANVGGSTGMLALINFVVVGSVLALVEVRRHMRAPHTHH